MRLSPTMEKVLPLARRNIHPKIIAKKLGIPKSSVMDACFWLRKFDLLHKAEPKNYIGLPEVEDE